jgi:uncharacterized Zn-binding protein involved in type VI secretion
MVTLGAMILDMGGPPDYVISGDPDVFLNGLPVARVKDHTAHGGQIEEGSDRIFINGVPAAFRGGYASCPQMTTLPGVTTSFSPHFGGDIVWNCPVEIMEGELDSKGRQSCLKKFDELERRETPKEDAMVDFCKKLDLRTRLYYPATPEYRAAALFLIKFCRGRSFKTWQLLNKSAPKGSTVLEINGKGIEIGDTLVIGSAPDLAETANVAGKGSIIIDQPLKNSYPAGTLVTHVPGEYANLVPPPPRAGEATSGTFSREGVDQNVDMLSLLGVVIILLVILIGLVGILIIVVIWRSRKKKD